MTKNYEPFSICDGFSKIVSEISPHSELGEKYGAGKTKIALIIKGKGINRLVLKKPKVHGVRLSK